MPAIKHLEKLRSDAYFKDDALPCIVREMREAPSNTFVAMHDHEFSELVIVAAGKISHIHADRTMNEFFPTNHAEVRAKTLGRVPAKSLPAVIQLINLIRREEHSEQPMRRVVCESLFVSLLMQLVRSAQSACSALQDCPVQKEIDFIAGNLNRKITLGELCAVSGKSASTLHREFRKAVGKSPGDYIIDMRIAKARTLLGRKGNTLRKVAAKTGFCCASHLSRALSSHKP